MCAAIQYLTRKTNHFLIRKTNEIFEARMQAAAQKIGDRQNVFYRGAL